MWWTLKRAEKDDLEHVFRKYATVQHNGEWFMTHEDFVCRYLGLVNQRGNTKTIELFAGLADTTKRKLISFTEFRMFEGLLCSPDAVNQVAFKLFDVGNSGTVTFADFEKVVSSTVIHKNSPFDFDSPLLKQYFGEDKIHSLNYLELCQLLQSVPTEHGRQAFSRLDPAKTGMIDALQFVQIMGQIRGFRMSPYVHDNLLSVAGGSPARKVSYPYFKAFNQLLGNLDLLEHIVTSAVASDQTKPVTQDQIMRQAERFSQITPLQINLMFQLCNLERGAGTMTLQDFHRLMTSSPQYKTLLAKPPTNTSGTKVPEHHGQTQSTLMHIAEGVYRFALGALAGATGATAVYPIDLVKTRLQNQRGSLAGEIMYKNSVDCFKKVVRNEGFFGLYRGLLPQLVGVAPEKAIKLTMNDTLRQALRGKDEPKLALWKEIIAGSCAGGSQVMFTNPLEIVKIRLQVAGEMADTARVGAVQVVKELGFMGLYKGSSACFLRDIPFSGIYFPVYAHMKTLTADQNGYNRPSTLFVSAFTAGVPAAALVTPADVIKTRLQVKARKGQQTYSGIVDCAQKVWQAEGGRAFWKGAPARVFRSSPQFGVTLLTYEMLQRLFNVDFKTKATTPLPLDTSQVELCSPDHIGGYRHARSIFGHVESRYGLVFPRDTDVSSSPVSPLPHEMEPVT